MIADPEPLGDMIRAFLERLGVDDGDLMVRLQRDWAALAGEPWASGARPVSLRDGELVVEASVPGTAAVLKYSVGQLHRRLDAELGGVIEAIRITQGRPDSARRDHG